MFRLLAIAMQNILDTILPRKERVVRIDKYALEDIPMNPQEHEACGVTITTLMQYREKVVEDLIRSLKYDHSNHAAKLLAGALAEYLREEIASMKVFSTKPVVLVPIPLHATRERERGFNQVERILDALPEEFKNGTISRIEAAALIRTRPTEQQTRLSRADRLTNVAGAFGLMHPIDAHVILVDDVTTTGATLAEAAKQLNGISITLLALAHA